jgi:hypothetical protein
MIKTITSDMNTPEHTSNDTNKQEYIDRLKRQLVQNQIRRVQGRDYGRILREYNTPAQWYKASPITCSIYYYDPNYQKYLQQQSKISTTNVRVSIKIHLYFSFIHILLVYSFTNSSIQSI